MNQRYQFQEIARVPLPGDNVAIATRRLDRGTEIIAEDRRFVLDYAILEGHRFAIQTISPGQPLLSWGLPFGRATRTIEPGSYVCNAGMLEALRTRQLDFDLPATANFEDNIVPYRLDEAGFQPAEQVPRYDHARTFQGYRRGPNRGVGTRNDIVLLGTTSRTASYVRQLEARLSGLAVNYPHIDGIVAVAHTEGGDKQPNNLDLLLRTLAGFIVHPNVGAVLVVDYGVEPVTNAMLRDYMQENDYPLDDVPHHFLSLSEGFQANLIQGESIVRGWLDRVNATGRTAEPVSQLKIALQCGGSDAFSGISGNPLAGWVAKEIIRYGGFANLAETDELIGAESYVLQKVKDIETAQKFLTTIARFQEWAGWHGSTAEGNPSGGNKYRGLYNIVLKSIGAAMKKQPEVRLDGVIDYGEQMSGPGFYFMDSPGNDLESIAGQVAAGSNMIFFVTGNGSITNFPFVPTLKVVTTTQRYELLSREMDVNAGAYLDGTPMDELGQAMLELTLEVASGRRSVGEAAGHAQVQLWRDWQQTDDRQLAQLLSSRPPDGAGIPIQSEPSGSELRFPAYRVNGGYAGDQVGLILPTSLCAGQIGRMAADRLNKKELGREQNISRFVSLVHTEGCGVSSGDSEEIYVRTLLGYLRHPLVRHCLLLEHGCEKTHNDYMGYRLEQAGLDPQEFGWASVQLDGGIDPVLAKIESWFAKKIDQTTVEPATMMGLEALRLGLVNAGPVSTEAGASLAQLTRTVVGAGGTIVVPDRADFLTSAAYRDSTLGTEPVRPSLAYGQSLTSGGFHIMETPSDHWVETLTGLGATGVEIILAYVGQHPMQSHPLVPVLQVTAEPSVRPAYLEDLDWILNGNAGHWPEQLLQLIVDVCSRRHAPKLYQQGNIDFQITRGLLGVSL